MGPVDPTSDFPFQTYFHFSSNCVGSWSKHPNKNLRKGLKCSDAANGLGPYVCNHPFYLHVGRRC